MSITHSAWRTEAGALFPPLCKKWMRLYRSILVVTYMTHFPLASAANASNVGKRPA